jgi:hypothetical protein
MTLDAAEIDLSKTFEIGQGYVALSRIRSVDGLRLMGLNDIALRVDEAVLNIDEEMKGLSRINSEEFGSLDKEELEKKAESFIEKSGGSNDSDDIKERQKDLENEKKETKKSFKPKPQKGGTVEITKKMLRDKKNISQIAKERGLAEVTILGHISDIKELLPNIDIEHLKPKKSVLDKVLNEAGKARKENNPDHFTEGGELRLKIIFENLNKKVSYEDIRLAMLFEVKK